MAANSDLPTLDELGMQQSDSDEEEDAVLEGNSIGVCVSFR